MTYFKIGSTDFSQYVSSLHVKTKHIYNSQTNARGNMVVDYINSKRTIEVGIIPLDDTEMATLLAAIANIGVSISYRNPQTNLLEENVLCIIPENDIDYYTIQSNKVMYKALKLKFTER